MPPRIVLTVSTGLPQSEFIFTDRSTCIIGRDPDCDPQVPDDAEHRFISRLHCMLDINPPQIRIRDLGSKCGTFVNNTKIGQREREEDRGKAIFPEHDLHDGDEVSLCDPQQSNRIVFRVGIHIPAHCSTCGTELPDADKPSDKQATGVLMCDSCRSKTVPLRRTPARPACVRCGKESAIPGGERPGAFLCAECKADPLGIVDRLLDLARSGQRDLLAIQGYSIERLLGKGGMGAVYLARHDQTRERLALKIMLPHVAVREQAADRFIRETEITRTLEHQHIVRLRDAGCCNGTFFFTLDYCEGGSVAALLADQGGTLSIEEAGDITVQALRGLEYAHQAEVSVRLADGGVQTARGLVHRDLSPQNLLLTSRSSDRVVKIADFGLAHAFDRAGLSGLSRTGTTAGKPTFLPRQQVVNFKYAKPDVDVWAMAACFYHMVTGEYPRNFPEGHEPWKIVLDNPAVPIRQRKLGQRVGEDLAKVIDKALVERPAIGFQSAAEFRQALEAVL